MIAAILFDFGGTLDTDGIHWSEKFWDIYQAFGLPLAKADYEKAYVAAEQKIAHETISPMMTFRETLRLQTKYQIAHLIDNGILKRDKAPVELDSRLADRCYDEVLRNIRQIRPLLDALKSSYFFGLVSNFTGNLTTVCAELGIDSYFPLIIDSAVVGVSKPDPEIFRIAVHRSGFAASDCVVVGDSYERDIVPGKLAGCRTIWLHGRSWKEPEKTDQADYTINSIMELPAALEMLNRSL
jgi:FMN hydrolase / 5-amino-6-(5-phospho-D-ribitylamino)uracil phosphatase